jgi:hypothetical protein
VIKNSSGGRIKNSAIETVRIWNTHIEKEIHLKKIRINMLLSKTVLIDIHNKNLTFYKKLGYDVRIGGILEMDVCDLPTGSHIKVITKCDYCDVEKNLSYKNYNKNIKIGNKYACSQKCSYIKKSEILMKEQGIENIFQSEEIKEKIKSNNIEKYGVEHPMMLIETQEKVKKTNIEKYGVDNYAKTDEWKSKVKRTSDKKYGGIGFQSKQLLKKISNTNLERYGYEIPSQSDIIKDKIKKSNIKIYGKYHMNVSEKFRKCNFKVAQHTHYIKFNENNCLSIFKCDNGEEHTFQISSDLFSSRINNNIRLCTICNEINTLESHKENELKEFIESFNIITEKRRFDKKEIDIYIPDMNIGFEFNGVYWHSTEYKDKNYHLNKTEYFKSIGIRTIHIWEDDWDNKKDIIKSQIKNLLNLSKGIGARKCDIREVTNSEANKFYNNNHIQGSYNGIKKSIGLYYKEELVCLMSFDNFEGRIKMDNNSWNLSRYCSKLNHNIQGGASKILKYFTKNYKPERIISYADNDWSEGGLYKKLGFKEINKSKPDYKYIVNGKRVHKSGFRKSITGISESKLNIPRIYDTGKLKYEILLQSGN